MLKENKQMISCGFARNYKGMRIYVTVTRGLNTWESLHASIDILYKDRYITTIEWGFIDYTIKEVNKKARELAHEYIDNLISQCA